MIKISIITINRNNQSGLGATFKSVFGQTINNFEYIVIDGASTDGSAALIKEYEDRINYWVSEPDKGIYNAMNKGIRQAKGEYLLFLNSGDILYDPSILQGLSEAGFVEDIIFGDVIFEGETAPLIMPDKISLETFLGPSIGHNATFIKAGLFEKYGFYNEGNKIVSDLEFFLNAIVKHGSSYRHINRTFTVQQKGGISVSPDYEGIKTEERMACFKRTFPEFYGIIRENFSLKESLAFYEHSRVIQLIKRMQESRLNRLKNTYFRFKKS
jgi:glycosyltransferase involved in cell wall biosynthesis